MTFHDFAALCRKRRSIRYFDTKPVTRDHVLELLAIAHLAPNVENLQPWTFHVVENQELRTTLMNASCYGNFVAGAAALIVVSCNRSLAVKAAQPVWNPRELEYSCVSAMEQLILAATAQGLGSCWVSLHHGTAYQALGLTENDVIIGGIMLGHYKQGEAEGAGEHQRKPLKEAVRMHE